MSANDRSERTRLPTLQEVRFEMTCVIEVGRNPFVEQDETLVTAAAPEAKTF